MRHFEKQLTLPDVSAKQLFDWHARPGAFERLGPPWQKMKIVDRQGTITDGSVLKFRVYQGPISLLWEAHHEGWRDGEQFIDVQKRGPFSHWRHTHGFADAEGGAKLTDSLEYKLPLHALTGMFGGILVDPMLEQMFRFRHERTRHDIMRHDKFKDRPRKRIAISGASGTVGTALQHFLTTGGHEVWRLTRSGKGDAHTIGWDIARGEIEKDKLEGMDAVIHLAGESINQRWSDDAKKRILESRRQGTMLLSETLAKLDSKPEVLVSASAVGFYGNSKERVMTGSSEPGSNFLATVCQAWEQSTRPAQDAGIRVVNTRFGIVLTPQGGALEQMLLPFKMGAGGRIGDGKQYMSWVAIDDALGALYEAMYNDELEGPLNVTAPNPVTNKVFTKVLGKVLSRPTFMPTPTVGLYALLGKEAAHELLLEGQRAVPERLQKAGFEFDYPDLEQALRHLLGR